MININDIISFKDKEINLEKDNFLKCKKSFNFVRFLNCKNFNFDKEKVYTQEFIESIIGKINDYTLTCTIQSEVFVKFDSSKIEIPIITIQDINQEAQNTVDVKNTFEVLYKTKEKLEDKDGNNIRKGSKLTEKEIEELGLDFIFLLEGDKIEETKSGK